MQMTVLLDERSLDRAEETAEQVEALGAREPPMFMAGVAAAVRARTQEYSELPRADPHRAHPGTSCACISHSARSAHRYR